MCRFPSATRLLAALGVAAIGALAAPLVAAERTPKIDFNRDIRPILANNCFGCHGPDDAQRQAGLRLDVLAEAAKPAESGKIAIVPAQPDKSELVTRILAADEAERMPPADSNKRLTDEQKSLLRAWIAAGAPAETHWSLVPPRRPELPAVKDAAWAAGGIDRFVLARLEQEKLKPSPPADRLTLVRRVYLDLVGLIPAPEDADAFARDERPEAYEELVDRLLASPQYGERWARRWLDLARYADTNGYEKDRARSVWPYRDWVIRAINADMPFDRFTIEQIAGDLLPAASLDARIATGFHRNTMTNEEGGIDVEEFRYYSIVDRVNTTGTVWLGLTIGCAQCHNHKFDPITQREYYQLSAFLNNVDEPELAVPRPEITARRAAVDAQLTKLDAERAARFDAAKFAAWAGESAPKARHWTPMKPTSAVASNHSTMTVLDDRSILVSGDKPNQDVYVVEFPCELDRVTAIRLDVLPHESLPQNGPGRAPLFSEGDFLLGNFAVSALVAGSDQAMPLALRDATQSYAGEKSSAQQAIDDDLDTGWSIKGRAGQPHHAVFPLAAPLAGASSIRLRVTLDQRYIHQMTIGHFRLSLTGDADPKASGFPEGVEAALLVPADQRTAEQQRELKTYYLSVALELAELNKQREELVKNMPKYPTTSVVEERDAAHRRATHINHRGEFLSPREVVTPGVPAVLHPLPPAAGTDRLSLARWLVDPRNPLVARVLVNRHWSYFFGRGLVRTLDDFGTRGEPPSHPELLDYLASELVDGGWSLKRLHRQIVTSNTYRQASRSTPEAHQADPANTLLARGPRVRVEAEVVRDAALCASGLLSRTVGGPSVFPPQPPGVTELSYSSGWSTSQGADRFRRGLYTYTKRTSPYAAFIAFDAPSGENCAARRERSNTPLQALTLLNDPVFVEAAQALARRAIGPATSDPHARARQLFRWCLTREPTADELTDLERFFEAHRARFASNLEAARQVASEGAPQELLAELAAWTLVGRAILNLDEFVTKE